MTAVLTEGRRYPACTDPDTPRAIYEVTCRCRRAFSGYSWDEALDLYLTHWREDHSGG